MSRSPFRWEARRYRVRLRRSCELPPRVELSILYYKKYQVGKSKNMKGCQGLSLRWSLHCQRLCYGTLWNEVRFIRSLMFGFALLACSGSRGASNNNIEGSARGRNVRLTAHACKCVFGYGIIISSSITDITLIV